MSASSATRYNPRTYRGAATRAIAMPLGGIGTGTIALAGDGSLRQWQIVNQVNHLGCVPHSFFALWARPVRNSMGAVARVLQSDAWYHADPPEAPPTSNDHQVPEAHTALLGTLPGVAEIAFTGEYPIAELSYRDPAIPLEVSMEALNPFVPLDDRDSGIPTVSFRFTVSNPTNAPWLVSLASTLQNLVGWDGVAPIRDVHCELYGGNTNALLQTSDITAIAMRNLSLPPDAAAAGSVALSVDDPGASSCLQWNDLNAFWADFSADGQFGPSHAPQPSDSGSTWNGALAVPFRLEPGASRTVTFAISWHFPNRYVNFPQFTPIRIGDSRSKHWLGNQYSNWWRSAEDVALYVHREQEHLTQQTRITRDAFFSSSLPDELIDAVTSQMSIIRTPTCFRDDQGRFWGFEGSNGASTAHHAPAFAGSCPLNCTHVWNYEMSLARLFPMLERDMRDTEWHIQQHSTGYLPHRVLVPTWLERPWEKPIGGPEHPALDGLLGAILKTWREVRATGDAEWLKSVWPNVQRALEHIWHIHDPDEQGVIEGEQPNTYDISIYGFNTFIGTLYLAALRAAEEMAQVVTDDAFRERSRRVFERGQAAIDSRLWNGEFYIQEVDLNAYPEQNWGTGCHADQLLGQWWAHALDLGHLLEPSRIAEAARAIFDHNFRESFQNIYQGERIFAPEESAGLLICTWPNGGRPDVPTRYSDEVWTGIEYAVAGLLLYEGDSEAAMRMIRAIADRYDGERQNPWNQIECGDHYVRAMSSWVTLEAATGYRYNALNHSLAIQPVLTAEAFRAPVFLSDGWGILELTDAHAEIRVLWGNVQVRSIQLPQDSDVLSATVDGKVVEAHIHGNQIEFAEVTTVPTGSILRLALG